MSQTTKRRGRPVKDNDVIAVAIPERGLRALWDRQQERFMGDQEITRWATVYATVGYSFDQGSERDAITCGTGTDDAILASLLAACGGRGVVLSGAFSDAETLLSDQPSLTAEEIAAFKDPDAE